MITLHPQIFKKDGQEFAMLPFAEFLKIKEALEDFEDLKDLRLAKNKEKDIEGINLEEARKELNL